GLATLRNAPGVKPEELRQLGLENWLDRRGPVSRQALQDYVAANKVGLEEVRKGYPSNQPTRFPSPEYQLPGGENYRETLLTLPTAAAKQSEAKYAEIERLRDQLDKHYGQLGETQPDAVRETARNSIRDILAQIRELQGGVANPDVFHSSHWPADPNPVAHYRTTDRTIGGKKTLFLEEVQSDWHQTGRKEGYRGDPKLSTEQLIALQHEHANLGNEIERLDAETIHLPFAQRNAILDQNNLDAKLARSSEIRAILDRHQPGAGVPDAPFRSTWPELTLKRAVRDAAEGGYDQIAWTPGKVQAERYPAAEGDITHGMESFYDKMLPTAANKIGKKYGAHTGKAEMGEHTVHPLPITPQLRDTALRKGFPLFQLGAGGAGMGMLAAQGADYELQSEENALGPAAPPGTPPH